MLYDSTVPIGSCCLYSLQVAPITWCPLSFLAFCFCFCHSPWGERREEDENVYRPSGQVIHRGPTPPSANSFGQLRDHLVGTSSTEWVLPVFLPNADVMKLYKKMSLVLTNL